MVDRGTASPGENEKPERFAETLEIRRHVVDWGVRDPRPPKGLGGEGGDAKRKRPLKTKYWGTQKNSPLHWVHLGHRELHGRCGRGIVPSSKVGTKKEKINKKVLASDAPRGVPSEGRKPAKRKDSGSARKSKKNGLWT